MEADRSRLQLLWDMGVGRTPPVGGRRGHCMVVLWSFQVSCGRCGNGLGHEFLNDGPKPGQSRF